MSMLKKGKVKAFLNAFVLPPRKNSFLKFISPLFGANPNKHNCRYKFTFESASRVSARLVTASFRTVHHPSASYTSFTFPVNQKINAELQNTTSKIPWLF